MRTIRSGLVVVLLALSSCSSDSLQEGIKALETLSAQMPTEETSLSPAPETSEEPPPTTASRPYTPSESSFGNGTHEVGSDIRPGTYRTRQSSEGCYWARLKDFDGELESIAANDNTNAPAVVTILATDVGFESTRCDTWTADLSRITTSKASFDEGTYIVATDLEPGTYRSSGGEGCYWARLRNFEGDLGSIVANDNTDGPTIVTIKSSDKGFTSTRCGTWTKR